MDLHEREKKFLAVLDSNKGIIYKVANVYCPDAEDRKDLVQEIIIQIWRSFDRYNPDYAYTTWLYRIALNVAISYRRKEKYRKVTGPLLPDLLTIREPDAYPMKEMISALEKIISTLKELDKALMLLYLEEKSYKEISEILGLSETNIATKVARIKNTLKEKFTIYT